MTEKNPTFRIDRRKVERFDEEDLDTFGGSEEDISYKKKVEEFDKEREDLVPDKIEEGGEEDEEESAKETEEQPQKEEIRLMTGKV